MRPHVITWALDIAETVAARSTCARLQVGCVLFSPGHKRVMGIGHNGSGAGLPNECQSMEPGRCGHVHAEMNALALGRGLPGFFAYVTHEPCDLCAQLLITAGVKRVVWRYDYRVSSRMHFARRGIWAGQENAALVTFPNG